MSHKSLLPALLMCFCGLGLFTAASAQGSQMQGAFFTGKYRNLLTERLGLSQAQTDERIAQIWHYFFEDEQNKVYFEPDDSTAYILDTGNEDVRTEGMSYGMMICVQLDKQAQFDRLWRWVKTHMLHRQGPWKGYYAWQCTPQGQHIGHNTSCASDGEVYFITALFFASHRWGDQGAFNYEQEAQRVLHDVMSKDGSQGVVNLFDRDTKLITFVPNGYDATYTDPSYNLPAFFELWARWTDSNKEFWQETPQAARQLLVNASHPVTGLFPDYSAFDGSPFQPKWKKDYDARRYQFDAIRCAMNVGMDAHWFATDIERQAAMVDRLLRFFKQDNFTHGHFNLDGTQPTGGYEPGMAGANAVALFACPDHPLAQEYLRRLWEVPLPTGKFRYYTGMVYMLSMLHVTGNFKVW